MSSYKRRRIKLINERVLTALAIIVLVSAGGPVPNYVPNYRAQREDETLAYKDVVEDIELTPENTVILSNETDGSFCRDFSVLLKGLRLEWVTLDTAEVPESARDKNLIIVGRLNAEYTGDMITELILQEEVDYIRQDGHYSVLEKDSPWNDNRIIYISAGSDLLLTKRAAEAAITSILEDAQARAEWFLPALSVPREEARAYIAQLQYVPDNDELPREALRMDLDAKLAKSITTAAAAEDVERLFYLLSHGWSGYGYFRPKGDFDAAKENILGELDGKSKWSPADLSRLIHEHLGFIHDCHLNVGGYQYCSHLDFWYDTSLELGKARGAYYVSDSVEYRLVSVNGESPEEYMFPSLNAQGDPIYRLGVLSYSEPDPLVLAAHDGQAQEQFEIKLYRSDFTLYRDAKEKFGEERIGGIPVLRARSFSDYYTDELNQFLQTAGRYKGEPYLIIDIRGNSGGNDGWPKKWIARFTGRTPSSKHIWTELISKTSMMGRVNACEETLAAIPEKVGHWIPGELNRYNAQVDAFERQSQQPHWTPLSFPNTRRISNETTIIVVADRGVGSAGEGLLSYVYRQVDNVVVVGENSRGAATFGQGSKHLLPHSKVAVFLPIKLGIMADLEWIEERGYLPDLWIPAGDALNYAVAAARKGTITTQKDLPAGYFEAEFVPEKPLRRSWVSEHEDLIAISLLAIFGLIPAYVNRKKTPLFFIIFGICWLPLGVFFLSQKPPVGYVFIILGSVYLTIGLYKWRKTKTASLSSSGDLRYIGNPTMDATTTSSGDVEPIGE